MVRFEDLPKELWKRIVAQADKTSARSLLLASRALSKTALEREWRLERIPCVFDRLLQPAPRIVVDQGIDRFVNVMVTTQTCCGRHIVAIWQNLDA